MRSVELVSAERGAKKISCTKLLQARCGLGLVSAKSVTDSMLEGNRPVLTLPSDEEARALIGELASLGMRARFAEADGYDPPSELAKAMHPLKAVLPGDSYQTITSLAEHGEWELALSHALSRLPSQTDAVTLHAQNRLRELAVEFGSSATRLKNALDTSSDA